MKALDVVQDALSGFRRLYRITAAGQRIQVRTPSQKHVERALEEMRVENLRLRRIVDCAEKVERPHAEPCRCAGCQNWSFMRGTLDGLARSDERKAARS